ncbi:Locomotion-related protein Hikaru genki [Hypsibius exemplaris]|uniref:Locomotion-related protein Hikaru genki n=1 Tax=Hypsibius exemplaris TaxID=2072580 RepID=A0A9X6N9I3_HYPEX|nr:Locomotion-related protein Hikaru genki [Hypsibius exemplaris]
MEQVGFPLFFGVVTTMVVIPNLLINCVPAADTPTANGTGSVPSHPCPPLKIYFPAFVGGLTNQDHTAVTRYQHLDSVLVANVSGADGTRRECQFVCLYGQWTGPLCRRMDTLDRASTNYQPVWQSCYFDAANFVNVSVFYNGHNISEPLAVDESSNFSPKMTVFPHGGRLMFRCKEVGEFIFHGPPVMLCSNGQWEAIPQRAGSHSAKIASGHPSCEAIPELESNLDEKIIYPPIVTYTAYVGTVAPYYDGRLFVYPGSDLHLGCIYEPRRLGPPKWTWSKSSTPDTISQWTRNLWRNKMEWRLTVRSVKQGDSGKYTCTTPHGSSHSVIVEVAAVDCPRPWDDEELITSGTFHFNSTVSFGCTDGHRLNGPSKIFCKLNGEWAQPLPSCVPVHCPPLNSTDSRLYIDFNGTAYDDVAVFSCSPGYKILGASMSICSANGNWSQPTPTCESVYCHSFHPPAHGYVFEAMQTRYLVGKIVQFACNKGFMPNGPLSATCGDDGKWSNPPPRCELACDAPKVPPHGRLTPAKSAYRVKSHVVYECHGGYRLVGARISYCNPDSKWSFPAPECLLDTGGLAGAGAEGRGKGRSQNY